MSDLLRLYQEAILEHHRAPHFAGRLEHPTHTAQGHNPLCGDRVVITARIETLPAEARGGTAGLLLEARCDARGCALCRASGSMLMELVQGRSLEHVAALTARLLTLLGSPYSGAPAPALEGEDALRLGSVAPLLEVRHFPSRVRCATLSWETLRDALRGAEPPGAPGAPREMG